MKIETPLEFHYRRYKHLISTGLIINVTALFDEQIKVDGVQKYYTITIDDPHLDKNSKDQTFIHLQLSGYEIKYNERKKGYEITMRFQ